MVLEYKTFLVKESYSLRCVYKGMWFMKEKVLGRHDLLNRQNTVQSQEQSQIWTVLAAKDDLERTNEQDKTITRQDMNGR